MSDVLAWIEKNSWMAIIIGAFSVCGILLVHLLAKSGRIATS